MTKVRGETSSNQMADILYHVPYAATGLLISNAITYEISGYGIVGNITNILTDDNFHEFQKGALFDTGSLRSMRHGKQLVIAAEVFNRLIVAAVVGFITGLITYGGSRLINGKDHEEAMTAAWIASAIGAGLCLLTNIPNMIGTASVIAAWPTVASVSVGAAPLLGLVLEKTEGQELDT